MAQRNRWIVFFCLSLIVSIALPRNRALRYFYPLEYEDVVITEALRRHVDPLLVAAVARVESSFDPRAVSVKGALGVMQVMPDTGAWVASRLRIRNWERNRLLDPIMNIRIGTWYLAYLHELFQGNQPLAVAAYNGGHTNVQKWLRNGTWDGTLHRSNRIPFRETRDYVVRVFRTYEWYKRAYPEIARKAQTNGDGSVASVRHTSSGVGK